MNILGMILGIYIFCCLLYVVVTPPDSDSCVDQDWYDKAAEKFGEDYYYPPCTVRRSLMNENGVVFRHHKHYKPVRHSTYSPIYTKLEPWFEETFICRGKGRLIGRVFFQ